MLFSTLVMVNIFIGKRLLCDLLNRRILIFLLTPKTKEADVLPETKIKTTN